LFSRQARRDDSQRRQFAFWAGRQTVRDVGNNDAYNDDVDPAQDLGSPLGRFTASTQLCRWHPTDNPFYNAPALSQAFYAYGLRNSFDFTFDPMSDAIFATENGDACDERSIASCPADYGWRANYPCEERVARRRRSGLHTHPL